jgi:hypothetical protein
VTPGVTSGAGEPAGISSAEGAGVPLIRDSGSKSMIRVSGKGIRDSGFGFKISVQGGVMSSEFTLHNLQG